MSKRMVPLLFLILGMPAVSMTQDSVPSSGDKPETTIRANAREVVLDVVVRDKHHRPVTDLRANEVRVFEDGVEQKINAFSDVRGPEQLRTELDTAKLSIPARDTSAGTPSTVAGQLRQVNFVSIVFAQIAPLDLEFAREAVQEFLKSETLPNTYVTIYSLNGNLRMVQSYTSDKMLLTKAVNTITRGVRGGSDLPLSAGVIAGSNAAIEAAIDNIVANPLTPPATAQALGGISQDPLPLVAQDPLWARNAASQDVSVTLGSALLTQAHLAAGLRFTESLSNGMDSLDAMRRLVQSQERLPGRKVVLYLADGLTLPMDRRDAVDGLISFANRAGVVFYTVDTRGLSVDDPVSHPLSTMEQAGAESSANKVNPRFGHAEDDDIGLAVTSNTQLSMEEIAESTGGFAVTNTNQIAVPMQRMMEDIRDHYEIAYTPSSTKYDGHFRTIEVKISRPHIKIQTRKGYFALPDINGEPLQPYEMAALKAINERPAPVSFSYDAALIKFRPGSDAVGYEMTFDIPISSLRVVMNHKTGKMQIRAALLALIHQADGQVIGKISRSLVRDVNKAELEHLANQHILYAEPLALTGGHYQVDTAVTDSQAEKIAVKHLSVFVDSGHEFGVSSLELVKSVWTQSGPRNPQDPYETDAVRILPTLSQSVPSGKPVDLYFVVYPRDAEGEAPKVTMQMFQNGKEIARKTIDVPAPQKDGSVPMLMRLNPAPGQCDVIVTAQQGAVAAQSTLSLKVDPRLDASTN